MTLKQPEAGTWTWCEHRALAALLASTVLLLVMWRGNCITTGLGMRKIVILLTAANSSISLKKTGYVSHDFYIVFWSSSVGRSNFKVLHSFLTSNKIAKILEGEADMIALTRKFCSC